MKPARTVETSPVLPADLLNRASALLVARDVRRPPETLAFLTQRLLRWWTVIKGLPTFDPPALKSLSRDFREMGFDCQPGKPLRWTPKQRSQAEALFDDLVVLVAESPDMELPGLRLDLKTVDRPLLVRWIWNHLDHHVTALTIGLLSGRILAVTPEDPLFAGQAPLRERVVQLVGTLVAFALYLGGEHGRDMPMPQAATTASALLDGLAESIAQAFALGGTRGRWLAHCGGWERPAYPCRMSDFSSVLQGLPSGIQPE
ncbi:MAG TPA: hypothetical protein VN436_13205 [Holophaga sp.]|nr:hypothetical protein [Holophaga sp.]